MIVIGLLALLLAALQHRSAIEAETELSGTGTLSSYPPFERVAPWDIDSLARSISNRVGLVSWVRRENAAIAPPARISVVNETKRILSSRAAARWPPARNSRAEAHRRGRNARGGGATSAQSLYRRFFGAKRHFSESEKAFFLKVDFVDHVALAAVVEEAGRPCIVGGGRYVVVRPATAEVAFAVIDEYQGQGIGAALMRHLTLLARNAGISELIAEVLPENTAMLKVFQKSGLGLQTKHRAGIVDVTLNVTNEVKRGC